MKSSVPNLDAGWKTQGAQKMLANGKNDSVVSIEDPDKAGDELKGNGGSLLVIDAHGREGDGKITFLKGEEILDNRNLNQIKNAMPNLEAVCLLSCGSAGAAQEYADRLGVPVYASNESISVTAETGEYGTGEVVGASVTGSDSGSIVLFLRFDPTKE